MNLNERQKAIAELIRGTAMVLGVDADWACAVAMTESSLGENQVSPTGCLGVFQMSRIAMVDLLEAMRARDDDIIDITIGILFLRLLRKRWGSIDEATLHYCDPNDRGFYLSRVRRYMDQFKEAK